MEKLTIIPDIEKTVIGGESEIKFKLENDKNLIFNFNEANPLKFLKLAYKFRFLT